MAIDDIESSPVGASTSADTLKSPLSSRFNEYFYALSHSHPKGSVSEFKKWANNTPSISALEHIIIALCMGWMTFFEFVFNREALDISLEISATKYNTNSTAFQNESEHIHHVLQTTRLVSTMSGFFLWSFLFTCTPLIMVRIGTILSMLSGVLLSLPYWVGWEEKNAEDFSRFLLCLIVGRALLCFAGTINYTYGVAYYFGNSRDTASHHQHYMLGSLVYAELIAEFFGMLVALKTHTFESLMKWVLGITLSAIIPLILTVKLNFFKKYGDRGISDNTVTPTRQASYKERVKTIYENYTTEFKLAIRQKDFFHRLLLCIAVVVTARIPFLLWNIESTYILKTILQIDEYRLVDLMIKSAVISCVFAICSAWFFAIGFQMHTKLCWVIIFALIFDLMFIYPLNEILNLNSEDFEDIVIGEAIIYAVLREALYEIMPNLFKRRSQVIAGCAFTFGLYHFLWFLVNENFFGLISLGDIFKDEFSFSEYVYYIVIIASKITFITLILLLYKWKRWHGFLVMPERECTLTELGYLTKIDYQDSEIYRRFIRKATNILENNMVIASNILQESNEYDVLFVTDSLFEALNEKVFENVIVIRAIFPLKISLIGKSLQLIKFNQNKAPVILLSIGFDHIIHRIPVNEISQYINEMLEDIYKKPVNYYGTSIKPISIVLITIPEIGEFKQEFKQFNNILRATVTTFQNKGLQLHRWKLLDWAAMIEKASKMQKRTFDRRLRLLIESYDKMKVSPNRNLPIKQKESKSAQSKSKNTEQENELEQKGIFKEKVIETHADSNHQDHEHIESDHL